MPSSKPTAPLPAAATGKSDRNNNPLDRSASFGRYAVQQAWLLLLNDLDLNAVSVLRRAQLPGDLFARENAGLDTLEYFRLWSAMEAESADAPVPLPLRIGAVMSTAWFDPAIFAALCSADLNAALVRIAQYKRLICPMVLHVDSTLQRTTLSLEWMDKTVEPPSVLMVAELVFFVQLARLATRSTVRPIRVGCPIPTGHTAEYESFFGVSVSHAAYPTVTFAADDARRPFLTANKGMWSFFEPALRQRLHELDKQATMTQRVRSALLEALPAGDSSLQAICQKLAVSSRTLQRRLRDEGDSFQQILNEVRRSLAQHYLENSSMSGAEISFLLGFEDPSSFMRAFKDWTGNTPKAARAGVSKLGA